MAVPETQQIDRGQKLVAKLKKQRKPLTKTQTKQAIKVATEPTPSRFVKRREMTILKERLKNIDRGVKEGKKTTRNEIKEIQTTILELIEDSGLEAKDRDKFRRLIKNIQTAKQLVKDLPEIESRIASLETKAEKRVLLNKFKKLLKQTKVQKQSGKPVGKFTAEIQDILDKIKVFSDLSFDEGREQIGKNLEQYDQEFPPESVVKENALIDMYAGLKDMGVQDVERGVNFLEELIQDGRIGNALRKFNLEEQHSRIRNKVMDVITGGKGLPTTAKTTGIGKVKQETLRKRIAAYERDVNAAASVAFASAHVEPSSALSPSTLER